ncbi:MAG: ribonuclease P protein component [Bacteroidota bacterium]
MAQFTFTKSERLKSAKTIARLFKEGQSFGVFPLRLVWLKVEEAKSDAPVQFSLTVPKKAFKTAVARNRLRRKIREAWRLNKHRLYRKMEAQGGGRQLACMVIYTAKEDLPFAQIEQAMQVVISKFSKKIAAPNANLVPPNASPS